MSDCMTIEERYMRARNSKNLRIKESRESCDADKLLAAGYAVSGSGRKKLALSVYQVLLSPDMTGAKSVADEMSCRIVRRVARGRLPRISRIEAFDVSIKLLKLWHRRTCPTCSGRGHPLIDGSARSLLDESVDCYTCSGSGIFPLELMVDKKFVEHARWLEREINSLNSIIFTDMARMLRNSLDSL